MKQGDYVSTPRFGRVKLEAVYNTEDEANAAGYRETTHYWDDPEYGILGKSLDLYHMEFEAYKKQPQSE